MSDVKEKDAAVHIGMRGLVAGILCGFVCGFIISCGLNLSRLRAYRQQNVCLEEEIRRRGAEVAECRAEVVSGLEDCREITDATERIRKQVEVLARYYTRTCDIDSARTGSDSPDSEN